MKHLLLTTIAAVLLVGTVFADPIHDVAWKGDLAGVQRELNKGADVNAMDDDAWTPLHYAATYDHKETAKLLTVKGVDVNTKNDEGETALHQAAHGGHKEVAEMLIAKEADVNVRRKNGYTPLDEENWRNKPEIADLLRAHGGKTGEELKVLMPRLVQHGRFAFRFVAEEGRVCEVQDSFDLLNWEVIKTYTGTGSSVRFDEERDHDPPKWFYRVRVVE